jgi:hypothetical protein
MSEPRRYVEGTPILTGEVFITISGRHTNPVPLQDYSSDRKCTNSLRRWAAWKIAEAVAEAESRGRDDLARAWATEDPKNLPMASAESMWSYTFENAEGVKQDKAHAARFRLRPLV